MKRKMRIKMKALAVLTVVFTMIFGTVVYAGSAYDELLSLAEQEGCRLVSYNVDDTFVYLTVACDHSWETAADVCEQVIRNLNAEVRGTDAGGGMWGNQGRFDGMEFSINIAQSGGGSLIKAKVAHNGEEDIINPRDPGQNDPGQNDPGQNDPGQNDPGQSDPGQSDPSQNDSHDGGADALLVPNSGI